MGGKSLTSPSQTKSPNVWQSQSHLYNMKCQQLKDKGILISPTNIGIQPIITNNSWITQKPSASGKPLEQCTVNDICLVMGFDPVNKYLQDLPGKVTTHAAIYSNLAKWQVMAKLDFRDFYHQIKFKTDTYQDKLKLRYHVWNSSIFSCSHGIVRNGHIQRQVKGSPLWGSGSTQQNV